MNKYNTLKNLHTKFPEWDIETLVKVVDSIECDGCSVASPWWDTWKQPLTTNPGDFNDNRIICSNPSRIMTATEGIGAATTSFNYPDHSTES